MPILSLVLVGARFKKSSQPIMMLLERGFILRDSCSTMNLITLLLQKEIIMNYRYLKQSLILLAFSQISHILGAPMDPIANAGVEQNQIGLESAGAGSNIYSSKISSMIRNVKSTNLWRSIESDKLLELGDIGKQIVVAAYENDYKSVEALSANADKVDIGYAYFIAAWFGHAKIAELLEPLDMKNQFYAYGHPCDKPMYGTGDVYNIKENQVANGGAECLSMLKLIARQNQKYGGVKNKQQPMKLFFKMLDEKLYTEIMQSNYGSEFQVRLNFPETFDIEKVAAIVGIKMKASVELVFQTEDPDKAFFTVLKHMDNDPLRIREVAFFKNGAVSTKIAQYLVDNISRMSNLSGIKVMLPDALGDSFVDGLSTNMKSLDIKGSKLSRDSHAKLLKLVQNSEQLSYLNLGNTGMSKENVEAYLTALAPKYGIKSIDLTGVDLDGDGTRAVHNFLKKKSGSSLMQLSVGGVKYFNRAEYQGTGFALLRSGRKSPVKGWTSHDIYY